MQRIATYIHEKKDWPNFVWNDSVLWPLLGEVRNRQGRVLGKMETLGFEPRTEAILNTLTLDVTQSTAIEGETLDAGQVRSSIARRLGIEIEQSVSSDRNVDGIVDLMLDATQNYSACLTKERLFDWHAALFPTGRSGMYKITVADWRTDTPGPMQVVSGAMGRETVHYQAPASLRIDIEMNRFLQWFNTDNQLDTVLKAAVAHLWFITIHPFDDGNGRIARALTDLLLARSDKTSQRFYSMSAQIKTDRKQYYAVLEKTQKGDTDITDWITWFLKCLLTALENTEILLAKVLYKAEFWNKHSKTLLNDRQIKLLNKLLEGFDGKLTTSKWAKIAKCSTDTALRDVQDLVSKEILQKEAAGGRSTNYELR